MYIKSGNKKNIATLRDETSKYRKREVARGHCVDLSVYSRLRQQIPGHPESLGFGLLSI